MASDTPRTDAVEIESKDYDGGRSPACRLILRHAEQLEKELNETHAELARQMQSLAAIRRMHGKE